MRWHQISATAALIGTIAACLQVCILAREHAYSHVNILNEILSALNISFLVNNGVRWLPVMSASTQRMHHMTPTGRKHWRLNIHTSPLPGLPVCVLVSRVR